MQFRTTIKIEPLKRKISHHDNIFSLGSCFAENIARKMADAKFNITTSPSGILFNPASIATLLECYQNKTEPDMALLQHAEQGWCHYMFHSSLSHTEQQRAIEQMHEAIQLGHEALQGADVVLLTFGTAWVFRHKQSGQIVANCHKQPQYLFEREMLSIDDIVERYASLMEGPLSGKRVIFTVSPVRHLSDGLEENSLSKAILRVAIDTLTKRYPNAFYFPSFEIMGDELRDYRFYGDDMIHPSSLAVDYIWERFMEYAFSTATIDITRRLKRIVEATAHRPFNPNTEAHRNFCLKMIGEIAAMECIVSGIDFTNEKKHFKQYL